MSSWEVVQSVTPTITTGGHYQSARVTAYEFNGANAGGKHMSEEGIKHEFSAPIIPQQNVIVERKNRTLQEMARVELHAKEIPVKL
ncbi:hypothetical protein LIER_41607 [Lithospermum erythrorhizon]|uniref:Uncharacterized protein n=1 Tax=Lithospermum erythrorhizon TaxID=34254 RepID=A0AAV3RFR0_LITER